MRPLPRLARALLVHRTGEPGTRAVKAFSGDVALRPLRQSGPMPASQAGPAVRDQETGGQQAGRYGPGSAGGWGQDTGPQTAFAQAMTRLCQQAAPSDQATMLFMVQTRLRPVDFAVRMA